MPRILFDGPNGPESHDLPIGPNGLLRLNVAEVRHIQRVAELTARQLQTKLFDADPDPVALTAVVQVLWKRQGKTVRFEEVDFDLSTLDFQLLPEEQSAMERAESEKQSAAGEDPTSDSNGSPTVEG